MLRAQVPATRFISFRENDTQQVTSWFSKTGKLERDKHGRDTVRERPRSTALGNTGQMLSTRGDGRNVEISRQTGMMQDTGTYGLFSNHRDFLLIKFDFTVSSVYWYGVYCVYCAHIGCYSLVMRYVTQQACAGWEHGSQPVALLRISWIMGTQAASNYWCTQLKGLFLIDHKTLLED